MPRHRLLPIAILGGAVLIVVYYLFDPCTWWTPKCPFKLWTGYSCPACGAQRAFHAALHFDLAGAVRYNLFLVIGLPYLAAAIASRVWHGRVGEVLHRVVVSRVTVYSYVALFFVWWVVRNLLNL